MSKRDVGAFGESKAVFYLEEFGIKIVERNFFAKGGEIDIIATEGDTLLFVEVKYRSSKRFGSAIEAITPTKLKRIYLAAMQYLEKFPTEVFRFDLIAIDGEKIEWVKNIFEGYDTLIGGG